MVVLRTALSIIFYRGSRRDRARLMASERVLRSLKKGGKELESFPIRGLVTSVPFTTSPLLCILSAI